MSPNKHYQHLLQKKLIKQDPLQQQVVKNLEHTYLEINKYIKLPKLLRFLYKPSKKIKGVYLWGPVGRGKTFLIDLLVKSLLDNVKRLHFHQFMYEIHQQLKKQDGNKNPITLAIKNIMQGKVVLCLDEFLVDDIADAMIISEVLQQLQHFNKILLTTSNQAPKNLYLNGLQRQRFIPAINCLEKNTCILELNSDSDYRLRDLKQDKLYHCPINSKTNENLQQQVKTLSNNKLINTPFEIAERKVKVVAYNNKIIWFEFKVICNMPRCKTDYLYIAKLFPVVVVSNIPILKEDDNDLTKRFIHLVDVFYENNVALIISAEQEINKLHQGEKLKFEFQRTISRIIEMQSNYYLKRPHSTN